MSTAPLPLRHGAIALPDLIHEYMLRYTGRDKTRGQRLAWWSTKLQGVTLEQLNDDHVHEALRDLKQQVGRYFAGKDADGNSIMKAKRKPLSPATLNRYHSALAAVVSWAIRERIAPKGFVNPCSAVQLATERNEVVRFLSDDERTRLLEACRAAKWPRLYALVLMALTTGARKGELLALRWRDLDLDRAVARCVNTKNDDAKTLPLVPLVVQELRRFEGAEASLVFPSTRTPSQAYALEGQWRKAVKAAKIKAFRFHDLRHSCASMLAASGATLLEIADVLGHRQLSMTRRYSHLTVQHKASLVNRVLGDIK